MAIENATYIAQLNPAYPAGGEPVAQGDDHIRMIKQAIKNSFPGVSSTITAESIPAVPNGNDGGTNVQWQLNNKIYRGGDTMTGTLWFNDNCNIVANYTMSWFSAGWERIKVYGNSHDVWINPGRPGGQFNVGMGVVVWPASGTGEGGEIQLMNPWVSGIGALIDIDSGNSLRLLAAGGNIQINAQSWNPVIVSTNNVDRFRICSSGNISWMAGGGNWDVPNPSYSYQFMAIGDSDTGIGWGGDGNLNFHSNGNLKLQVNPGDGIAVFGSGNGGLISFRNTNTSQVAVLEYNQANNFMRMYTGGGTCFQFDAGNAKLSAPLTFGGYGGTNSTPLYFDGPGFGRVGEIVGVHVGGQYTALGFTATQNNQNFQMRTDGKGYAPAGWATFCDKRLKSDIKPITGALEKLSLLGGYTFRRDSSDTVGAGVLAQEVQLAIPEAISYYDPETMAVEPFAVIGLLVEAVKELKAEVALLKAAAC